MSASWRGGRGARGRGKRKFAPQGAWKQSTGEQRHYYEERFPILHRPHSVPFSSASPSAPPPHKTTRKEENFLLEKAWEFWGPESNNFYSEELIDGIFQNLRHSNFSLRQVMALEYSQYLENYLWKHFTKERASPTHLLSICLMVNQKWRQGVLPWKAFVDSPAHFPHFMHSIMDAATSVVKDGLYSMKERTILLLFLDHAYNSLEVDVVREEVKKVCSLPIWESLPKEKLEKEFAAVSRLKKYWNAIHKKDKSLDEESLQRVKAERSFLWKLMHQFLSILESIPGQGPVDEDSVSYCERFLEMVTDLLAQLHTRKFFKSLMLACHLPVKCSLAPLAGREPEGHLFKQLLLRLQFYAGFEINDHTGLALTDHEMMEVHYQKITSVQRAAFALFPELRSFSLSTVCGVDSRSSLLKHFSELTEDRLCAIAHYLHLVPEDQEPQLPKPVLLEVLVAEHERRQSQLEAMNSMPLYPTEEVLWDINLVPSEFYSGETCLALPKLNLQFLTLHDYLLRNFELFRLESTYEIREDIEDAVSRLKPWGNSEGGTEFSGWARMALPIATFSVVEVGAPHVGEDHPSRVRADVTVELTMADTVKKEWEGLRKHDVCFLISVQAKMGYQEQFDWSKPFVSQVGLKFVRGCEIEGMLDENGRVIEEGPEPKPQFTGNARSFRVWLDTNQYQRDMTKIVEGAEDVYESFNIIMRRKPKENNFKAVLETIRDLMNAKCVVPEWLHDVFLGYGDPGAAHYRDMPTTFIPKLDFNDTFISYQHLLDSFPGYDVQCDAENKKRVPPFVVEFPPLRVTNKKRKRKGGEDTSELVVQEKPILEVTPYHIPNRGPYPFNKPKKNCVPFTPTQVEAIVSGMQPGLTMVVGPPGTGKTDVAVQIISNLYHNFPNQRTLLVTHSNQALNQLFEKIMALDIDERHLLRLGHGEEELSTEKDFSRYGRVNFILALRMDLLKEVERLQDSIGVTGDVGYTCETASYFFLYQVAPLWEKYYVQVKAMDDQEDGIFKITELFPFTKYFSTAPQPLFKGKSFTEDLEIAEGCYRHLKKIFKQLERFRPFELLRTGRKRIDYLMACEAKIVAMTCTHAALKRRDMVDLAFKYDNVLMEEAAQILEVETFIPLMLQNPQDGHNRLKRVIMIGDHHQLPPVIKNMSFQKYSNMEQSMFTRFVRLGVPVVQLDGQGRARPSLCCLYKWRYRNLGDLPHVLSLSEYKLANAGMLYDYQLIDVQDFNGVGETEPTPHFIQNLAEAEYAVALFMYLRLQGYPPEKIAILTTYNGQKHLIRDVLARRCGKNPVFGLPEKVTTVDRYQGQQNDYVILSLVRTKHIGHLRDVRRLVVALSRARLGLYILARVGLFQSCTELQPAFQLLLQRPTQLHLVPDDFYPTSRSVEEGVAGGRIFVVAGMGQLADYVYRDYHVRISALQAQAQHKGRDDRVTTLEAPPISGEEMKTNPTNTQPGVGENTQPGVGEITQPGVREITQPGVGENTQPGVGEITQPGVGENTQPGAGENTQPSVGENTQPGVGANTQPDAGEKTQPSAEENGQPSAGENTQPDDRENTQPDDGENTQLDDGENTQPDGGNTQLDGGENTQPDGQNTQPSAEENTQPSAGKNTQPSAEENTQPSAEENTQPSTGENTQPSAEENTQPSAGENVQPDDRENTQPDDGENTQPGIEKNTQPGVGNPEDRCDGEPIKEGEAVEQEPMDT